MAKYDFVPGKTGLYILLRRDELGITIKDNNDDNLGMLGAKQGGNIRVMDTMTRDHYFLYPVLRQRFCCNNINPGAIVDTSNCHILQMGAIYHKRNKS